MVIAPKLPSARKVHQLLFLSKITENQKQKQQNKKTQNKTNTKTFLFFFQKKNNKQRGEENKTRNTPMSAITTSSHNANPLEPPFPLLNPLLNPLLLPLLLLNPLLP